AQVAGGVDRRIEQHRPAAAALDEAGRIEAAEGAADEDIVRPGRDRALHEIDGGRGRHRELGAHEAVAEPELVEPLADHACLERLRRGTESVQVDDPPREPPGAGAHFTLPAGRARRASSSRSWMPWKPPLLITRMRSPALAAPTIAATSASMSACTDARAPSGASASAGDQSMPPA